MIRLTNLKKVMKQRGMKGPTALGRAIDRERSQCSALINGKKGFGEDMARHIERELKLPRYWLDVDHGDDLPPQAGSHQVLDKAILIVRNQDDQSALTSKSEQMAVEASQLDMSNFSMMATKLATEFDQIKDKGLRIEVFARCIAAIQGALDE